MTASSLHPWRDGDPVGMGWRAQAGAGGTALPQASRVAPGTVASVAKLSHLFSWEAGHPDFFRK